MKTEKRKVAIFQSSYGRPGTYESDGFASRTDEYVKLSEDAEVEFTMLPREDVVNGQIKQIDSQINEIQARTEKSITDLLRRRNELLALPCE